MPGFGALSESGIVVAIDSGDLAVDIPDDLRPAYARYVSQWDENACPWEDPRSVRASQLGSRLQSMASGISASLPSNPSYPEANPNLLIPGH